MDTDGNNNSDSQFRRFLSRIFNGKAQPNIKSNGRSVEKAPDFSWELCNQIPQPVKLDEKTGKLPPKLIPPFGRVRMSDKEFQQYTVDRWVASGIIKADKVKELKYRLMEIVVLIWAGIFFYSACIWGVWKLINNGPPGEWWKGTTQLAIGATVVFTIFDFFKNHTIGDLIQSIKHSVGGVFQLIIAFSIPASVILGGNYFDAPDQVDTTAAESFVNSDVAAQNQINENSLPAPGAVISSGKSVETPKSAERPRKNYVAVVGPILQILMIGILSVLPALMFYLFDRKRLSTLKEEFYRAAVMLVPSIHTIQDAKSVFGVRADALLGYSDSLGESTRFLHRNRSIIFITTIVVSVAWTVSLANDPLQQGIRLTEYLTPSKDVLVYAFLGAYTFGIALLFRRYARSDIKPSAYASFTVRTVSAIVLAWVVQFVMPEINNSKAVLVVAFFVGFFPDTGITAIKEFVKKIMPSKSDIPTITEKFPLNKLDGINIYHRTRLVEEGVENIENLAHADLINLMLQTRIPLSTLIDWVDQSILYLHVLKGAKAEDEDLLKLRAYGIRTASDLIAANNNWKLFFRYSISKNICIA